MTDLVAAIAELCERADGDLYVWFRDTDRLTISITDATGTWHVGVKRLGKSVDKPGTV